MMKLIPASFLLIFFVFFSDNLYSQSTNSDSLKMSFSKKPFSTFKGYYHGEEKISRKECIKELEKSPAAFAKYKEGKKLTNVGRIVGIPSALVLSYCLIAWTNKDIDNPNKLVPLVSGVIYCGGLFFHRKAKIKTQKAIKIYNQPISLGMNINGIGLSLKF